LLGPDHELVHGRLYGPAVFPLALAALLAVRRAGLPVIAGGGIYRPEQVEALLAAGASAVQVDAVLWRAGWWRED
jgi:dihydroorotate dehydrogenase